METVIIRVIIEEKEGAIKDQKKKIEESEETIKEQKSMMVQMKIMMKKMQQEIDHLKKR